MCSVPPKSPTDAVPPRVRASERRIDGLRGQPAGHDHLIHQLAGRRGRLRGWEGGWMTGTRGGGAVAATSAGGERNARSLFLALLLLLHRSTRLSNRL